MRAKWWIAGSAIGIIAALAAFAGYYFYAPAPAVPRLDGAAIRGTIRVSDRERSYLSYIPARLPQEAPLVLVLHGAFMDGAMIRAGTGYEFDVLADRHGFAVVYPDGYEHNWNDCRRTQAYPAKRLNIDDMGFMRALIARFRSEHGIDPALVFVFGYSDGGEMAYRLAIEAPDEIAAITAVEANLPTPSDFICKSGSRTSRAMIVGGTDDPIMPFYGGEITLFGLTKGRGEVRSALATAEYFVSVNGLAAPPEEARLPDRAPGDQLSVDRTTWSRGGIPIVAFYQINGGGHVVAQPVYRWPRFLGRTFRQFNTPAVSWDFLAGGTLGH